jgi:hypothetical protein
MSFLNSSKGEFHTKLHKENRMGFKHQQEMFKKKLKIKFKHQTNVLKARESRVFFSSVNHFPGHKFPFVYILYHKANGTDLFIWTAFTFSHHKAIFMFSYTENVCLLWEEGCRGSLRSPVSTHNHRFLRSTNGKRTSGCLTRSRTK